MRLRALLRNSKKLRFPLMVVAKFVFLLMRTGPAVLRRAVYDTLSVPFLVAGNKEYFVVSTADKTIGRELFLHGEFDFHKLQLALAVLAREKLPQPCHLIDVGANIGTIVIPALKRGLVKSATAIEPHPGNLRLLRANLALNELLHEVEILEFAVGDASGETLHLEESEVNSGNHSIGREGLPVSSMQLDELGIPVTPALIWMDIEGYEGHALKGAEKLLAAGVPVVCEYNSQYLLRSNGMNYFLNALRNRRIFDLSHSGLREISLNELAHDYPPGGKFTDILAVEKL